MQESVRGWTHAVARAHLARCTDLATMLQVRLTTAACQMAVMHRALYGYTQHERAACELLHIHFHRKYTRECG